MTPGSDRIQSIELRSCGRTLPRSENRLGGLNDVSPEDSADVLRARLEEEGYLLLRGFFAREKVAAARRAILGSLSEDGALDPAYPMEDGVVRKGFRSDFRSEKDEFPEVREIVEAPALNSFFDQHFQEASVPLKHIWLRMKSPGRATAPHCDIVYMNRGSQRMLTIWIPLGDVPLELGPLMVLEKSHRSQTLRRRYCKQDVAQKKSFFDWHFRHGGFFRGGQYTKNPVAAQQELGGRWLTSDFFAGDVIIFSTFLLHGSLDNQTDRIRLSADARYQPASDPMDPRWGDATPSTY